MEEGKDRQLQAYIQYLNQDMEDYDSESVVLTTEAVEALADVEAVTKHPSADNNADGKDGTGTIIVDADGNYYFQSSKGTVEVKPIKMENSTKVIATKSATVVSTANLRIKSKSSIDTTVETTILEESSLQLDTLDATNDDTFNQSQTIIGNNDEQLYELDRTSAIADEETNAEMLSSILVKPQTTMTESAYSLSAANIYKCNDCKFETNMEYLLTEHVEKKCKNIAKSQENSSPRSSSKEKRKNNAVEVLTDEVITAANTVKRVTNNVSKAREKTTKKEEIYDFDENEIEDSKNADGKDKSIEVPTTEAFLKPLDTAANADLYKCTHCTYTTNKKFLMSRHMKSHSDDRPYKCSICEKGFKTSASLVNHVNFHLGKKPHGCTYCDKAFTTSGELVRHVRYRHTGVKPHKCTECDYSSVEMSKLKRHMRCHTGERPYQCPHCTYASPDSFKLKRHLRTHTGEKPYECDICNARFTQSNSLKYHRLIHSVNEKPVFQCPMCPTTCGRKTDLRLHMQKLHSSDKTWPCNRCGKELPDRYSYKVHIKTHEGEKCFRCKLCPYASITQRHLDSHMLIHTDEKPFVCEICEVAFRQKQLLNRHVNLYHNEEYKPPSTREKVHVCPHCNRSFSFKGNLMRHMEVHDPFSRHESEKLKLKLGRMNRLKPDGTVIQYSTDDLSDGEQLSTDIIDTKATVEQEITSDEYMLYPEDDEQQGEIQYSIYDDFEADETLLDQKPIIKIENATKGDQQQQAKQSSVLKNKDKFIDLQVNDGQNVVVIKVMHDDADDGIDENTEVDQEQDEEMVIDNMEQDNIKRPIFGDDKQYTHNNSFGFVEDDDDNDDDDADDANEDNNKQVIELFHIAEL
uniref:C2H2-type domain-containing protein n=1 Tax=Glossina pallidipes TaxID=7398 RepID=A0A1A9ZWH4_GLOPL